MCRSIFSCAVGVMLACSAASPLRAEESTTKVAASLQACTVTVRAVTELPPASKTEGSAKRAVAAPDSKLTDKPADPGTETADAFKPSELKPLDDSADGPRVMVCTGISLGKGLVVTYVPIVPGKPLRITLAGGDQTEARLLVTDHFSGLSLWQCERLDLPGLPISATAPDVGEKLLTAAGWGVEKPVVSQGMLSASNRALRGAEFPPLLQCDIRTAETASGSPLLNSAGQLVGVIVATDTPGTRGGWTYAVPSSHVERLLNAHKPGKVVVLARYRPVLGLKLTSGKTAGTVVVERVDPLGPAAKLGIAVGDEIVAADGLKIRSVYQVQLPLLQKQPGDKMTLAVHKAGGTKQIEVVLGGGIELPASDHPLTGHLVDRRVEIQRVGPQQFDLKDPRGQIHDLSVDATNTARNKPVAGDQRIVVLEKALDRYGLAIVKMQEELKRREAERTDNEKTIDSLKEQISSLQKQLEAAKSDTTAGEKKP